MKPIATLFALLVALCVGPSFAQTSPDGRPSIRLDKSSFAVGESVFFWVGAGWANRAPIPKEYWDTCRLTITRPDGTNKVIRLGWPTDGPTGSSWMGGCGLGEAAKPGRYLLVMEFAGQKTGPTPFLVESVPEIKRVKAAFVFGTPAKIDGITDTPVTLTVHNDTKETIRFPHRDGTNAMVSVSLVEPDKTYSNTGFYPADGLLDQDETKAPDRGSDEFTWKDAHDFPTITLAPGQTYTQRLSLQTIVSARNTSADAGAGLHVAPGSYRVTFSTTLQVLIGEEDGDFSTVSPVHIPVETTAVCTVAR